MLIYFVCSMLVGPLASTYIKSNIVQAYKIPAGSMIPTLMIGDHMLVDKKLYKHASSAAGDIVVFPYPKNPAQDFVKRIVGVPADTVEIRDKQLFINGSKYEEPYVVNLDERVFPADTNPRDNVGPITVTDHSLFILGDNRDNSHDSRFWGFIDQEKVKGNAVTLYWSWDREN